MTGVAKMRHVYMLQNPVATRDAGGGLNSGFEDIEEIWCAVVANRTSIDSATGQRDVKGNYVFRTRYRSDLSAGQALYDSAKQRRFIIDHVVDENERGEYALLTVRLN